MKQIFYCYGLEIINFKILFWFFLQTIINRHEIHGIDYDNTFTNDYGEDWVLMRDVHGHIHYIDLTQLPSDQSRLNIGDVYFHLYTRDNPDDYEELTVEENENNISQKNLKIHYFNPENYVKFVTHGWMSSGNASVVMSIKDAYLRHADLNVITVDWHELAHNIMYPLAALSTRYVGIRVAEMITTLTKCYNISGDQIHLIGHSLGAHVMGYAGSFCSDNISRITGMDPARPFFEIPYFGPSFSLDQSDATFVDVVHTCGGVLGYMNPTGHADFFPNNGRAMQPGCDGVQPVLEACSHGRAYELFAESIESETGFLSYPCESWESFQKGHCYNDPVLMGDPVQENANGAYYLYTNSESKYAMKE